VARTTQFRDRGNVRPSTLDSSLHPGIPSTHHPSHHPRDPICKLARRNISTLVSLVRLPTVPTECCSAVPNLFLLLTSLCSPSFVLKAIHTSPVPRPFPFSCLSLSHSPSLAPRLINCSSFLGVYLFHRLTFHAEGIIISLICAPCSVVHTLLVLPPLVDRFL
jgi:hypothetical protein